MLSVLTQIPAIKYKNNVTNASNTCNIGIMCKLQYYILQTNA